MTPAQHLAYAFIRDAIERSGICPTVEEIAQAMGVASKSNAQRVIEALIRDGHLVRGLAGTARNLRLANGTLTHVPTSSLMAELERRGVRLG